MKILRHVLSWLVTILVPLALVFLGLRLMLTNPFLQVEYRTPGFPPDTYGFTLADRLHYAPFAVDYLVNGAGISYLGNLTFPDGTSLFNTRELSHMQDVKVVVQAALKVGYADWLLLLLLLAWALFGGWWREYLLGVKRGGWLSAGLAIVLGVLASLNFWQFFADFHGLFFQPNSWMFADSDTLIRLFPLPFWEDAFLFAGLVTCLGGLALGIALRPRRS
jgi:integral membrane protein (TIGR01906 family)